jgi:hypothetical protein
MYVAIHEMDPEDLGCIFTFETAGSGYSGIGEFVVGTNGNLAELFTTGTAWYFKSLPTGEDKTVISVNESFAGMMREVRAWARAAANREQKLTEMGLVR